MKIVRENINFERGKNPNIGMSENIPNWDLFKNCYEYANISENFEYVSDIIKDGQNYLFNIESKFYYTDEGNNSINIQWVVKLNLDEYNQISVLDVLMNDLQEPIRSVKEFCILTEAFSEESIKDLFESNFERNKDPEGSLGLGERGKLIQKYGTNVGNAIFHLKPFLDEYGFYQSFEDLSRNRISVVFSKPGDNPHDDEHEIEISASTKNGRALVQILPDGFSPKYSGLGGQSVFQGDEIEKINRDTLRKFFSIKDYRNFDRPAGYYED
jgi:hypothetical protein